MPFLLETRGLTVKGGREPILEGADLEVGEWEIVGIVGPSDSGRALVDALTGVIRPSRGTIRFRGVEVTRMPPHRRAAMGMARTWQGRGGDPRRSVLESLVTAQHRHVRYNPVAGILGAAGHGEERGLRANAEEILHFLGLRGFAHHRVADLMPSHRQVVDLAMALATDPTLIVLDEPGAGLLAEDAAALGRTLLRVRDSLDLTMVLADGSGAFTDIVDYVYVLDAGSVRGSGKAEQFVSAIPG